MATSWTPLLLLAALTTLPNDSAGQEADNGFYGKYIGKLKSYHHGVSGDVFAVDSRTLHIRDFTYDGEGPAAYFYVGSTKAPGPDGVRIPDEKGSDQPLPRYVGKHVTLTLPESSSLSSIKWFSVWCDEFSVNFGDVRIPKSLDYPRPQKIQGLSGVHGVSSDSIVIVDAQTLLIPNFSYDGEAPDAKFWVGRGAKPGPQGVRVPDENGQEEPLRRYDRKTIVLTLPGDLTVLDIGHFGVWCEAFAVDFGHVRLPARALNVPPSLRMLGVSPQSKLNCEVLHDDLALEVRWAVAGDSIVMQLVGRLAAGEYMAFGPSGEDLASRMIGGDVVVAWVDHASLKGYAVDYLLDAKSQCSGSRGSCPDVRIREGTNSVEMLNSAMVNGYSIVTYQRPLAAQDELDRPVLTNGSQAVIWAVGPLNSRQEVSYHSITSKGDLLLDFGRAPKWNCPLPEMETPRRFQAKSREHPAALRAQHDDHQAAPRTTARPATRRPPATPAPAPTRDAWDIPPIQCHEPEDGVFYAQMGPTGGKHGYPAITGHVGWGISWYINGLLIPEIDVVRGKTYTFVVEGGLDPEVPARYHPFYITDDPVGGYEHKTPEERAEVQVFAGVRQTRRGPIPTGTGRLCNWTPDQQQPPADEFASFGAYQRTLSLECDEGEPGVVQWTPDRDTPDTVYYQCYTHRYLGWKINVLDSCDYSGAASELVSSRVPAEDDLEGGDEDLQSRPSIRVTTRVKPNGLFPDTKNHASATDGLEDSYLKGFPRSSELHPNSPQDFYISKSMKPVRGNIEPEDQQYEGHISSDPHVPPPAQQKEPQGIAYNSSATIYHLPQATEASRDGSSFLKQTAGVMSKPGTHKVTSESPRTSPASPQHVQMNNSLSTIDPKRKPIVHATTPYSVLPSSESIANPVNRTEQKLDADKLQLAEESQQSVVTVNSNGISPKNETKDPKPLKSMTSDLTPPPLGNSFGSPPFIRGSPLQNFGITRIPQPIPMHPQMPFQRPAHIYNGPHFRRPVPPRSHPRPLPSAAMYRPHYVPAPIAGFKTNLKKPFHRAPVVMASSHHPVIVTPSLAYHPLMSNLPHRGPYQQQLMSTVKYFPYSLPNPHIMNPHQVPPVPLTTEAVAGSISTTTMVPSPDTSVSKVKSVTSDNQTSAVNPDPSASILRDRGSFDIQLPVAQNTGFHPESVIVEGGFKPLVNKKVIAEDRLSLVDEEKVDVKPEDGEDTAVHERKENPFEGQQPETFEPMFIPSPPDKITGQKNGSEKLTKNPLTLADELVPPTPGVDHGLSAQPARKSPPPHIVRNQFDGARRPMHGHKVIVHYHHLPARSGSPSFRYQQASQQDDETAMAAERMDIYYLPPDDFEPEDRQQPPPPVDGDLPPGAVVAYDGRPVIDSSLASSIPDRSIVASMQTQTGSASLLQRTPQFGPYLGEVPPPVPGDLRPESIPQLQNQRPSSLNPAGLTGDIRPVHGQRTQLLPVAQFEERGETADMLLPEATDIKESRIPSEVGAETPSMYTSTATTAALPSSRISDDTSGATALQEEIGRVRRSASAHHSPEHDAEHEHDHQHGDHDHHHHQHPESHDQPISNDLQTNHKLMTAPTHPANGALKQYSIPSVILMALLTSAVLKFLEGVAQ
ncbi:protein Skeletor, isoforms D/E-like [Bacillus rossius redtenbacheri]|uniref:protein Skeletor, isoforms D/E-like n=1 Tax=Bacillus rossius redtenbacheri TaxID=93214 RepID=UPI002FDE60C6